jgi:two-component system, sensor histidine kinase LadS
LMFTILELHNRNSFAAAKAAQDQIITMENQRRVELAKTRTMAQFIDMMGHEARNTLAVINMSISGPSLNTSQRARVHDAIGGLTELIDRCYQAIRIDNQGQSVTKSDCDLTAILRKFCEGHIQAKRIVLATPDSAPLQSDQVLLAVICGNLIDNALKYSPADTLVQVDLQQLPQGVTLVVANHAGAAGLPDPAQVFQKYYRNPRAKAEIGAGLGLYIVRGLVHLLSGAIAYTTTDGRVSFKVSFPC